MENEYKTRLVSFKHMILLTIPIFIELLLQLVVGYSDQIMMSEYPDAVNGITNASTVINMVITFFQVFAAASIILITQYRGSRDKERENNVYSTAFWFNLCISLIFSIIIITTSRFYLGWLQTPNSALNDAIIYSMIAGGSVVFQAMSSTLSSFLKANSLMKESMIITLIVNIINIVGNFFLIRAFAGIGCPIYGVAISSAFSRIIGFIMLLLVYIKRIGVRLSFTKFIANKATLKVLLMVGGPSGGEALSYNSSQIIIQLVANQIVNFNQGNVGIGNVKAYASMFAMVTYMFTSAVSQAMQVIIGELLGAGETEAVDKKVKQTILLSTIASTSIACLFFLISDYLFAIFKVNDPYLLGIAKTVMGIEIALELGRAFNIVYVRALQTSGDVNFPTITAIIFCWTVAVGGSFILASPYVLNLGLAGIWIAMATDELTRAVIFIFRWCKGKWKSFNLARV